MSSSATKIAPALQLGGRVWRLQKEMGQVVKSKVVDGGGSFGYEINDFLEYIGLIVKCLLITTF